MTSPLGSPSGTLSAPERTGIDSRRAWLTVVAAFFSSFVSLGIAYSFGAFFGSMADEFGSTRGATAVIFGITTFAFFWLSLLTGRAADIWGPRPVLLVGALALFVGLMATSRVDSLGIGYLTYGAGVGIAAACGYIPMVAVVGGWFEESRATAVGLAVAGIGAGTMVLSPLSASLIERYGWRDTFQILAVGGGVVLVLCAFATDRPPGQTGRAPSRFAEAFASPFFRRLQMSAFSSALALFVPFVFVGQYARDEGVGSVAAAVLVGVLGAASIVARIGFGSLVRRFGALQLYRMSFVLISCSFVVWLVAGGSYALLIVFVLILGTGYGAFVALSTIVLAERLGVVGLGSIMGLFYTTQGLGGLIGPAATGWLIDRTGGYTVAIVACAVLAALARVLLIGLPEHQGAPASA